MRNLLILIILVGLGYFAYNAFNTSGTLTQPSTYDQLSQEEGLEDIVEDLPETQQGALVDINNQLQGVVNDAKEAVKKTQDRVNTAIEEGITDLEDTDIDIDTDDQRVSNEPGLYVPYEAVNIANFDDKIVLDFHATWCPSCRKLEEDIKASLNDIPSDLAIVKVDYDNESDLKKKYGVTRQHTLVQVDQQGNMIHKWSGGSTLESIVAELK